MKSKKSTAAAKTEKAPSKKLKVGKEMLKDLSAPVRDVEKVKGGAFCQYSY
jgi:hypothetical protein